MTYRVCYKLFSAGEVKGIDVAARSKAEAYEKATYNKIPEREGEVPYSAWVESVTYQNGNYREFNTFSGNPY